MQDLKLMREILVNSGYKNDELIKSICGIVSENRETAIGSYSHICELLSLSEMTLSEYIFRLAVNKGRDIFGRYFRTNSEILFTNIGRDIKVLSEFSSISAENIVSYFRDKFGIVNDIIFPIFQNGHSEITVETVLDFCRKYGATVYAENKAFMYENGELSPIYDFDRISVDDLKNYEVQRNAVIENTLCFIQNKKYSNTLLYGDRGTGKSSTVKAIVNKYDALRIVLVPREELTDLYRIFDILRDIPLKFIIFLDDLSFAGDEKEYSFFKQALEGSVRVMPDNCVIYATTNRRHIVKETSSERSDEHSSSDARDEKASLADRFGLFVTFLMPDKKTYLDIAKQIAADRKLHIPEDRFEILAERFAIRKAGRSPRTARQLVDKLEAYSDLGLDLDKI